MRLIREGIEIVLLVVYLVVWTILDSTYYENEK